MAIADRPDLFENDEEMSRRYETVFEFLADSGSACCLSKDYLLQVLCHIADALHMNTANESMWKAYVLLDVLIDGWDECASDFIKEENENASDK